MIPLEDLIVIIGLSASATAYAMLFIHATYLILDPLVNLRGRLGSKITRFL